LLEILIIRLQICLNYIYQKLLCKGAAKCEYIKRWNSSFWSQKWKSRAFKYGIAFHKCEFWNIYKQIITYNYLGPQKRHRQIDPLFFSVTQQPKLGLGHLTVEVSRSHTIRHTQPVRLLWKSDQLTAETATYTTCNRYKTPNIHALSGIRIRSASNRAAAGLRLRPHGHRDRHTPITVLALFVLRT
jgi:hypothetical protein